MIYLYFCNNFSGTLKYKLNAFVFFTIYEHRIYNTVFRNDDKLKDFYALGFLNYSSVP